MNAPGTTASLRRALDDEGRLLDGVEVPDMARVKALYMHMRRVRRLDERMQALQRQGRIGFYGSCTGQEAAPVAAALCVSPQDWVFPALRESSLALVRGLSLERYLAQLFGNGADTLKGRQMPSHHASRAIHHVSWSSAIGTQLPHAVGAAMAAKRLRRDAVMVAFLGDGATSHPDFHAALNFAGVFAAPVLFICQNNQYAISLPAARQTASATFAQKASAYGVFADRVDGNDALVVLDGVERALTRARAGLGATLLECLTYRVGPHSSSDDPSRYREESEVRSWQARDPISRLAQYLQCVDPFALASLDADERAWDAEIDKKLGEIEGLPPPPRESLFHDVYAEVPWHLREQRDALLSSIPEAPTTRAL
ncbi:MAG TPA: thiamine pyrophosphate-dependent enzyme [Polyangiaceae bacterium]|nr:thiamine pyrophosphate-dependent enzyme [Polyangiaceae bacterium]